MGAAFSPDGSKVAATLSQDGNSEIYLLSREDEEPVTNGALAERLMDCDGHALFGLLR